MGKKGMKFSPHILSEAYSATFDIDDGYHEYAKCTIAEDTNLEKLLAVIEEKNGVSCLSQTLQP